MESHSESIWTGKTEELGENPVPIPLCPPQIPCGLTWAFMLRVVCWLLIHIWKENPRFDYWPRDQIS
jgi:hypothetical protein